MGTSINIAPLLLVIAMPFLARRQVDKVYLNNNSVIYGKVVHPRGDSITLRLEHSTVKLRTDEVEYAKVRSRTVHHADIDVNILDSINESRSRKTFSKILLFKVLVGGKVHSNDVSAGASAIGVYRFRPLLQVGADVGYEVYSSVYSVPAFSTTAVICHHAAVGIFYYDTVGYVF